MRSRLTTLGMLLTLGIALGGVPAEGRAAQAMLSCPGMAQAGQPLTVEVTIAVGTTPLCRVCWPDHPGECGQQIQSGGKPHRSGRDELDEAGAEPPQEGQADPQAGWGEGDPGDEGQDAEALFRLRGGAQGCRQWRPGGARSVDQTGSRSSRVALSRSYAAPPSTRMTAPVVKLDAWLAR